MEARLERMARNEDLFRQVNENVHELNGRLGARDADSIEILCECGSSDCQQTLPLTGEAYETVRRHPARFAVLHGHAEPEVEVVVARFPTYQVVQKVGDAAAIVEKLDPRG